MEARENDRAGEKSQLRYSFYRSIPVVVYCRYLTAVRFPRCLVVTKQSFKLSSKKNKAEITVQCKVMLIRGEM